MNLLRSIALTALAMGVASTPAQAQLIHHWNFTNNADDLISGAMGNASGPGVSVTGGVLKFDGTASMTYSSHLVPTSGDYTVSLFVRTTGPQAGIAEFISQGYSGGPGFYIGSDGGSGLRATDSWYHPTGANGFNQDGQFHSYTLAVGAGISNFYLDGVLAGTLYNSIATTAGGTDTRFGDQFGSYGEFLNGEIDEVRIYANELSAQEIAQLSRDDEVDPTPEPASVTLMLTGLLGLGAVAKRRRKS